MTFQRRAVTGTSGTVTLCAYKFLNPRILTRRLVHERGMVSGKNFSWDNVQDHQLFGGKTPWFPIDFPSNHSIEYTVDEYIYDIYI